MVFSWVCCINDSLYIFFIFILCEYYNLSKYRCISKFVRKSDREPAKEGPKYNLYVKNLGEGVTEDLLREKFSVHGEVYNAVIMKNSEGKSRGFGFVSFYSPENAKKAEESLNGALLGTLESN